jgi:hypothetical protein
MPSWLPPLAAATLTVVALNIALFAQRARRRAQHWPTRFLRDLDHWDGRLPDDFRQRDDGLGKS